MSAGAFWVVTSNQGPNAGVGYAIGLVIVLVWIVVVGAVRFCHWWKGRKVER